MSNHCFSGVQLHPSSERPVYVSMEKKKYLAGCLSKLAYSVMHCIDPQRTSQLHFYYCQKSQEYLAQFSNWVNSFMKNNDNYSGHIESWALHIKCFIIHLMFHWWMMNCFSLKFSGLWKCGHILVLKLGCYLKKKKPKLFPIVLMSRWNPKLV